MRLRYPRTHFLNDEMKIKNIVTISILTILITYLFTDILLLNSNFITLPYMKGVVKNPGTLFFFKNNVVFFLVITILPYINFPILILQMASVGVQMRLIGGLSFEVQFNMLYRHLVFEFIALLISIYCSYYLKIILNKWHQKELTTTKKDMKILLLLYVLIISLTYIAALLEGGANV